MVRRRTEVTDRDRHLSLVVDHISGFDTPARGNRAVLDRLYARIKPGYRRVAVDDYEAGGRRGYEWRYRIMEGGRETRRADLMFDDSGHSFAVMAVGNASYADLAALARGAAASVVVTGPPESPRGGQGASAEAVASPDDGEAAAEPAPTPASSSGRASSPPSWSPAYGTYTGLGHQRSAGGAQTDQYTVVMSFSSSGASVSYPDLQCSGRLAPRGGDGGSRVYAERIRRGSCREGRWTVRGLAGGDLVVDWRADDGAYRVTGRLAR
jgi:hypothetical protein